MNLSPGTIPPARRLAAAIFAGAVSAATAQTPASHPAPPLPPDLGLSLVRVFGALALVIGLFLGGVWLFRNWQRLMVQRGRAPKLNVLETRSLGGRQTLCVVGYEQERFLIASSPAGVSFLTHLPAADAAAPAGGEPQPAPSFTRNLVQALKGK